MLLLATDLDGTFLEGRDEHKKEIYDILSVNNDICLVYVTGRGLKTVIPLFDDMLFPVPDYIICDVGATIVHGRTYHSIEPIQEGIEIKWPGTEFIREKLSGVKGLKYQEVPMERRCSFFYNSTTDFESLYAIINTMEVGIIRSAGKYVDILPKGVNKGNTLKELVRLLKFPIENIMVAGDTLNDLSLFETGFKGVVVGGAEEELLKLIRGRQNIYTANQKGIGGILEAFGNFSEFRHYVEDYFEF